MHELVSVQAGRVGRGCCTHFEWPAVKVHAVQRAGVNGDVGIDASVEQQLDDVKHAVLTTAMLEHTGLPEVLRVLGTEASGVDGTVVLKNDPCALVRIGMRVEGLDCDSMHGRRVSIDVGTHAIGTRTRGAAHRDLREEIGLLGRSLARSSAQCHRGTCCYPWWARQSVLQRR